MPQGCVRVDGNTFLGCLHQFKLWMPCQQVKKSLNHPACLASSPFQPRAMLYRRTGSDAPSACIQARLRATACFMHQVLPALPVSHLPRILGDTGALQMLSEEQSHTTLLVHRLPSSPHGPSTPRAGQGRVPLQRHSPLTPLETSCCLRWERDHILTQGMQVEAAKWGWFR